MKNRLDFIKECIMDPALTQGVIPIDVFQKEMCVKCLQPQCLRSLSTKVSFDQRVQNWEENLFINPPTASETDPNFNYIREKKFLSKEEPISINVSPVNVDPVSVLNLPKVENFDGPVTEEKILEEKQKINTESGIEEPVFLAPSVPLIQQAPVTGLMIKKQEEGQEKTEEVISESGMTYTFE